MPPPDNILALAAKLFEARGLDLLSFLRRRLGSDADARDIAQETYLRFIRLGDPDRINNPEAYLFRIASNLLWEHRLRQRNLSRHAPLEQVALDEHTPFDLAVSTQLGERINLILNKLPPLQRAVLILHLRDGVTCADIGARSGISASMVKKHLSNALAFCRRKLSDYE